MLKLLENAQLYFSPDMFGRITGRKRLYLQVGKRRINLPNRYTVEWTLQMASRSEEDPVQYLEVGEKTYWRYEGRWYTETDGLDSSDVKALVIQRELQREQRLKRAKTVAALTDLPQGSRRTSIPDDVKLIVWQRDGAACVKCEGKTELQYDHIIPVSMGGSNTEENIQLLCGPCNRRKGASVT